MKRNFFFLLILISLLSLILRLEVCRELFNSDPLVTAPLKTTDMYSYIELSDSIYSGVICEEFYYQPFYYAFFLPAVYLFFGHSIWSVLAMQSLAGAATVWLSGICASMVWGRRAGIIAAAIVCLSRELIFFSAYCQIETLKAFMTILLLFLVLLALKRQSLKYWILSGFICGLLICVRANSIIFIPAISALILLVCFRKMHWNERVKIIRERIVIVLIFVLSSFAALLPYSYHNYLMSGKLSGPSTAGLVLLALASNPEAPPAGSYYSETYSFWTSGVKPVSSHFIGWFMENPLDFMELAFRKTLLFWNYGEITDNVDSYRQGHFSPLFSALGFIPTCFYMILFLAFIVAYPYKVMRRRGLLGIAILVFTYSIILVFFCIVTRYRIAIIPLMAVISGIFIELILKNISNFHVARRELFRILASIAICGIFVFYAYDFYRGVLEKRVLGMVKPSGDIIRLDGRTLYSDSGNMWYGGWRMFPFVKGDSVVKSFSCGSTDKKCIFRLRMQFTTPGSMLLKINGREISMRENDCNAKDYEFHIEGLKEGIVILEALEADPGIYLFADFQRDYGRTVVNGENIKAELVSKIYVPD